MHVKIPMEYKVLLTILNKMYLQHPVLSIYITASECIKQHL
uniref:Uncharacterized protein n=1 Tax=Parascaris equorum TaxID=6256 RepID=A0A914RGA6_PAREQ